MRTAPTLPATQPEPGFTPGSDGKISVYSRKGRGRRSALDVRALRSFSNRLRHHLRVAGFECGCLDVMLTGDRETADLNARFRHKDAPADVLSFPWHDAESLAAEIAPSIQPRFLGEIVISTECAGRNAAREGHSLRTELAQLVLHGALHLLGWDHETDDGEMDALELRLRRDLGIEGGGRRVPPKRPATTRAIRRRTQRDRNLRMSAPGK